MTLEDFKQNPRTMYTAQEYERLLGAKTEAEAHAAKLINRLEEIKAMDRSNMTRSEKRALRKEVRGIEKELKTTGGGVYLSVGAIIIIILLLILIL